MDTQPSPLLDKGTELHHIVRGRLGVSAYPSCGEASVTWLGSGRGWESDSAHAPSDSENRERALRRARSRVRRYCRHNRLTELLTLTYADPPELDGVSRDVDLFWRRWRRVTGLSRAPFCLVPEWGKKTGRLHLHMAVNWWGAMECVEVCEACATVGLLRVRGDIPRAGSLCIGCVWGHGFVGRPNSIGDVGGLTKYLAKYLGKDLGAGLVGRQRYRVAQGFLPPQVRFAAMTYAEARSTVSRLMGNREPSYVSTSEEWEGYSGPGVVWLDYGMPDA